MKRGVTEDDAYSIITELVSVLSFNWDACFYVECGFQQKIPSFKWANMRQSCAQNRQVNAYEIRENFNHVHPFKDNEVKLARLYRIAKGAKDIYSKILFYWHILDIDNNACDIINSYHGKVDNTSVDIDHIMSNPYMLNGPRTNDQFNDNLGYYLQECVRNSIAHIERQSCRDGRSLKIDLLGEIRHLDCVSRVLKEFARYKLDFDCGVINRHDDPEYLRYFNPD